MAFVGDTDVEPDGDPVTMRGDDACAPLRVLQGGRPEVHSAGPRGEGRFEGGVVPDTAGQLHVHVELADHLGQQLAVGALAERGVEIHQMDPLGAVSLPGQRRLQRRSVRGLRARLALHETDGLTVGHVHGGK